MGSSVERLLAEQQQQARATGTAEDTTEVDRLLARDRANVPATQPTPPPAGLAELYAGNDPDRAARILRARRATGLASDVVGRQLDEIERQQRSSPLSSEELARVAPATAGWLAEDPDHLGVARPDITKMSYLERQFRHSAQEFGTGVATVQLTRIGLAAMMGQATEEHRAEQARIEHELGEHVDYGIGQGLRPVFSSRGPDGDAVYAALKAVPGFGAIAGAAELVEQIPGATAQQLPITGATLGTKALGAGVGAAGGSLAGPGGTAAGALAGWKVGGIPGAAVMEASTAYLDYEKLRDERGQPLDRRLILGAAMVTGAVNGSLEALSLEQIAKTLPGIRTLGRKGMRELLAKQTSRQALEHTLKAIGESALTEGTTEFLQEYVTNLSGRLVQLNQNGRAMSVGEFLEQTIGDPQFFAGAVEAGKGGLLAALGTGGAGGVVTTASKALEIRKAERRADVFRAIADGAKDSELLKRLPEAHQELVSRMTKNGPLEKTYLPIERFTEYFQEAGLDPADVAAELTGSREAFDEATRTGGLLEISTAAYATKLAGSEHHAKLVEDLTFSPTELSLREARDQAKRLDEESAAAAAEEAPVTDAAERVTETITEQLRRAGLNEKTARTYASALYGTPLRVLASRGAATDAEQLLKRFNLTIHGAGAAEAPPLPQASVEQIRQAHVAARTAALEKTGQLIDADGEARFAGSRTPGGARRPVDRVSTRGLLAELLELEDKRADAENRSVYELREDPNFHTEGIPQIAATRKSGQASRQAKALQNLEDFKRISEQVEAELEKRGLSGTELIDAVEDLRSELDERAAMEGDFDFRRAMRGADTFVDESGRELFQPAAPIDSPEFRAWFGDSKVVDEDGNPLVVLHGTTRTFESFNRELSDIEADWGGAFYFTNTEEDVAANYAGVGPDLQNKITRRAEQLEQDIKQQLEGIQERIDAGDELTTEEEEVLQLVELARTDERGMQYNSPYETAIRELAQQRATTELTEHGGATMAVFLSLQNPAIIGGDDETRLTYTIGEDEEGEPTEESGTLIDFIQNLRTVASGFDDGNAEPLIDEILGSAMLDDGISVREIQQLAKNNEEFSYFVDYEADGNPLASHEILREALERTGFDGIIDHTVNDKFGDARSSGQTMEGMHGGTTHYVAFRPEQVKSAIANRGTFDPRSPNILEQRDVATGGRLVREAEPGRDTSEDLDRAVRMIEEALDLEDLHAYITPSTGDIELASIRVRRGERKRGTGTRALQLLLAYADRVGRRVTLDAAERDPTTGTTSRARLVKFYKRFGFVENKGRRRDFTTRRQMIRPTPEAYQHPDVLGIERTPETNQLDLINTFGSLEATGAAATELAREAPLVAKLRAAGLPTSVDRIESIRPADRRAWVDLRGIRIASPRHAAQLLSAFRNPRMERMHVILMDDTGQILSHSMETSGAIGYVAFADGWSQGVIARAKRVGATRAYIAHNHPSGVVQASSDDVSFTAGVGFDLQKAGIRLEGQLVIDHTQATVIAPGPYGLGVETIPITPAVAGEDWTFKPGRIGSLRGPQHVANLVAGVVPEHGFLALYLDSQHQPVAVEPHTQESIATIDTWLTARRKANAARYVILAATARSAEPLGRLIAGTQKGAKTVDQLAPGERESWAQHVLDVIVFDRPGTPQRVTSGAELGTISANPEQAVVHSWRVFEGADADRQYGSEGEGEGAARAEQPEVFDVGELRVPGADVFGTGEPRGGLEGADVAGRVPEDGGVRLARAVEESLARGELERARLNFQRTAIEIRSFPDQRRQELIDALRGEPYMLEQGAGTGPRGRIRIGDNTISIELLANANLSTFIHETGHFYLEVLGSIAGQENAPAGITADYTALREAVGAKPGEPFTRQQHEEIARMFEAYLLEGNAPSAELRTAFARFRTWLIMLYKSVRGLRVQLTPEVRGVFDRLFATDEEIAAAQQELGAAPLFGDPIAAGMAENVAADYGAALERAQQSAESDLAQQALADLSRERKAWWKEERERTRADVAEQVYAEPLSRALAVLQKGKLPDGTELPADMPAVKLDRKSLVEAYGKEIVKALPRGLYAKEGGITADDAAVVFGFRTGGELLQGLVSSERIPSRIERLTDERMKREHGDMLTDGSMAEKAMAAVHNEDRARVLRLELEHLVSDDLATAKSMVRTLAGEPSAVAPTKESIDKRGRRRRIPDLEQLRDHARRTIAAKQVRDIRPILYRKAEAKASRLAIDAFTKGDFAAAFEEKSRELFNHELFRAATSARTEAERIADYMRGFEKTSTRARIGKVGGGYLEQIDALRERYSFTRATQRELGKRRSLAQFAAEQEKLGNSIDVPAALLDEARRQHWQETSLEELQGLRDTIEQLEHLAQTKEELLASENRRNMEDARAELTAGADEYFDLTKDPVDVTRPIKEQLSSTGRGALAVHTRMEFLFQRLDGFKANGPFWTYFFQPFARAEDLENTMRRTDAEAMKEILSKYSAKERRRWFTQRIEIPAASTSAIKGTFTKSNVLAIALNWGNQYNRDALMEGYGWNEAQVQRILATLDARDAAFVQAIWDHIDSYWPAAEQLEKQVTGLAPEKVEASPLVIAGVPLRGGYYPIAFDREQSSRQMALDLSSSVQDMARGYGGRAMTRHGHLIERTSTGGKPLLLELSVINRHLGQVTHDLSHRLAVIDAIKLIKDPQIQSVIERAVGMEMYQQLGPWVASIAGDVPTNALGRLERIASRARMGATAVGLGLNIASSFVQTIGFSNTVAEIGARYAAHGIRDAYGSPWKLKETWEFVTSRSLSMRDRLGNFDREVRDLARKPGALGSLGVDPSYLYQLIGWMDMGVSIPSWLGAYRKAMDGAKDGITAGDERAAIDYADSVVRTTQAAGAAKDLAAVQRGSQWWKLNTAFYSSMSVLFNQFAKIPQRYAIDKNGPKAVASLMLVWFLPAVLEDVLRGRGPEPDDDKLAWAMKKIAFYPLSSVVLLRDFASSLERSLEFGRVQAPTTAVSQIIESAVKTAKAGIDLVSGDELTRADLREAFNTVGYFAQWPTRQLWKTGEYFHDWWTGDTSPTSPVDAFWGIVQGTPKEDRSR